MQRKRMVMLNE